MVNSMQSRPETTDRKPCVAAAALDGEWIAKPFREHLQRQGRSGEPDASREQNAGARDDLAGRI